MRVTSGVDAAPSLRGDGRLLALDRGAPGSGEIVLVELGAVGAVSFAAIGGDATLLRADVFLDCGPTVPAILTGLRPVVKNGVAYFNAAGRSESLRLRRTLEPVLRYIAEQRAAIEQRLVPLIRALKERDIALRIGVNHGSLADRLMVMYGDTPEGMVQSALEFIEVCEKHDYRNLLISLKASRVPVMIQANRLMVQRMDERGMKYPLHLGVTEAGTPFAGGCELALHCDLRVAAEGARFESVSVKQANGTSGDLVLPAEPTTEPQPTDPAMIDHRLVVTSSPAGARVTVDGIGWGVTPLTIKYLPPGEKIIRVTKEGYVGREERVVVGGEQESAMVRLTLRRRP